MKNQMTQHSDHQQRYSRRCLRIARHSFYAPLVLLALVGSLAATASAQNFYVQGRQLFDECGEAVTLRGVNKMAVWDNADPTGVNYFPEIKKTGANVVRIVWLTDSSGNPNATVANLDAVIQNCRDNHMIPMIELHDATMQDDGGWSKLPDLVNFWTRADVVAVLNKHQRYLLINIGNEVGNDLVTDQQYFDGYSSAVNAMRNAGYRVPIVIDAAYFGQGMSYILNNAQNLINADPQHNLIFSLHVYWHFHPDPASDFINAVDAVVAQNIPFIVGEFNAYGAAQGCFNDSPYQTIMQKSQEASIGWLAWEWGPGNGFGGCQPMDMTPDGQYTNIYAGWARDVAIDSPYSIKNTAVTPNSIANGQCANQPPPPPPPPASTIEVWWPTDTTHLSGVVPFKALVRNTPLNNYQMFWQVDGDTLNLMDDSFVDAPHKESWADVSGWNWKGSGPYVINFVARDFAGNIIAQQAVTIYVDH